MVELKTKKEADIITFYLEGKLNSEVAVDIKKQIQDIESKYNEIILDFKKLLYVSSAGLRVILEVHKEMKANNKILTLINVDQGNMDILIATGLSKFLNIKND